MKVVGPDQNRLEMNIFKGGVDSFSYFSLISVILFSNQDQLWNQQNEKLPHTSIY
jgi:hypothetical protein